MEGRGRWDWDPSTRDGKGMEGRVGWEGREGEGKEGEGEEISIHSSKLVAPPMCQSRITLQPRSRPHDRQLIPKLTKLYDSNFIVRMLYKQMY